MAKKNGAPEPRQIKLRVRPVNVSNVNLKPEKHGHELVERVDVSIAFVLHRAEIPHVLALTTPGADPEALWYTGGEPRYSEIDGAIHLSTVYEGTARIGYANGTPVEFNGRLKKLAIVPIMDYELEVKAQVRVDPGPKVANIAMLSKIQVEQRCKFGFDGIVLTKPEPDDDGEGDNDAQEALL